VSYAVDTNIWARSLHQNHPSQQPAKDAIKFILSSGETVYLLPQNLYELWVVLTRRIEENGFGLSSADARKQLEDLEALFMLKADSEATYTEWKNLVEQNSVKGKVGHDARIVAAMNVHEITHLLTLNPKDFKRFQGIIVVTPEELLNLSTIM
jgi:predicted nucleic acid-binding protein